MTRSIWCCVKAKTAVRLATSSPGPTPRGGCLPEQTGGWVIKGKASRGGGGADSGGGPQRRPQRATADDVPKIQSPSRPWWGMVYRVSHPPPGCHLRRWSGLLDPAAKDGPWPPRITPTKNASVNWQKNAKKKKKLPPKSLRSVGVTMPTTGQTPPSQQPAAPGPTQGGRCELGLSGLMPGHQAARPPGRQPASINQSAPDPRHRPADPARPGR